MRLLRRLTYGVTGAATGAVVVFATIGAATIPGRSADTARVSTSATTSGAADTSQSATGGFSPQASSSTPQASSASSHVVSGGS